MQQGGVGCGRGFPSKGSPETTNHALLGALSSTMCADWIAPAPAPACASLLLLCLLARCCFACALLLAAGYYCHHCLYYYY
jgi:hypothetical protein